VADFKAGRIARPLDDAGAVTSHTKGFSARFHCLPDPPNRDHSQEIHHSFASIAIYAIEAFSDV
jgi:hypothetical protein